jgi:cyclophilin family peptidyl-prolyl cis-trans isomerase
MAPRSSAPRTLKAERRNETSLARFFVVLALGASASVASACGGRAETHGAAASSSAAVAGGEPAPGAVLERLHAIERAEQRRASADVMPADLAARDVRLRRAAARALARIADARTAELLVTSLADEDASVVVWSAYGLGAACAGRERAHSSALAARAASLLVRLASLPKAEPASAQGPVTALFEPIAAIADALGRCGGAGAEKTLRAWVGSTGPIADAAGFALGGLASRTDRLEDATLVALLDAAGRAEAPVASALQAFTRLGHLDDTVRARLQDVARRALAGTGERRALAVRALGPAGAATIGELEGVVRGASYTTAERADAVRGLARLGADGQRALGDAVGPLADEVLGPKDGLMTPAFGVLSAALSALDAPDRAGPALARLVALEIGGNSAAARRTVALRCAAASVLAGRGTESSVLARCDPDPAGRSGRLALLRVLDRGPLRGQRGRSFRALAATDDATVRERALELVAKHPELERPGELVAAALGRKTAGDVATAARLIADHPDRVATSSSVPDPDPAVTKALGLAVTAFAPSTSIEVRSSLADAAGAVALLGAKPVLEADCKSDNPTLRKHAEKALRLLGNREQHCDTFAPGKDAPAELEHLLARTARLDFETDAGNLSLELYSELSPVASTRLVELARSGFYDGIRVHRVVPGFVVQLGDRDGDGYGGVARPPLRCETSPASFEAGSAGIALSGRDTGSSQFFVTLAREPHLDGEYALLGRAGPGWERVVEGDVVTKVTVHE